MLDHFQMGPNLVRGFAPIGIGPREIGIYALTGSLAGFSGRHQLLGCVGGIAGTVLVPAEGSRDQGRCLCRRRVAVGLQGRPNWIVTNEVSGLVVCATKTAAQHSALTLQFDNSNDGALRRSVSA